MTKIELPTVNYASVARYLHSVLYGKGVDCTRVFTLPNGNRTVSFGEHLVANYFAPPDKRSPSLGELTLAIRSGPLGALGFVLFSDNMSNTFLTAPANMSPPPVDDLPVDMEKFARFLLFLFSKRFVFTQQDAEELIHEDYFSQEPYVLVNESLIKKFRVRRGFRPPTRDEVSQLLLTKLANTYETVSLGAPHDCLAVRPRPRDRSD